MQPVNEETKEKLLSLKSLAEETIKTFKAYVKEINALGFNVMPQEDDTIYIFRDHREAFGVPVPRKQPMQQGANHANQH